MFIKIIRPFRFMSPFEPEAASASRRKGLIINLIYELIDELINELNYKK